MKQIGNLAVVCAGDRMCCCRLAVKRYVSMWEPGQSGIRFTQRGTMMTPFSVLSMN